MKSGQWFVTTLILLGLLAGTVPPASAEEPPEPPTITFHVTNVVGVDPIPADSEDTIVFEAAPVLSQSGSVAGIIQNLCEGEDCAAQDIYWRIELDITWDGDGWFPNRDQRPTPRWMIGSAIHMPAFTNMGKCGDLATYYGSCEIDVDGMIPAEDIPIDPDVAHESFVISFSAPYGGLAITTSYKVTFSTSPIIETLQECAGQYIQGGALGTITLDAKNYAGVNLQTALGSKYPAAGAWYAVTVTSGAWQDDGTGEDLRTMAIRVGTNGYWLAIDANPRVGCSDVTNDTYYLQMTTDVGPTYLRVGDFGDNWGSNTGALVVTITSIASYNRYPSGCELQYKINNLIEQQSVNAEWVNGWALDRREALKWNPNVEGGGAGEAIPIRYLALETIGGPANLGPGGYTWDADLGPRPLVNSIVPSAWYEIQTAPFVTCVVATDLLGHVKVFFPLDQYNGNMDWDKLYYAFRVRDTGAYTDNSGTLGYRLYEAALMQVTTPGETPSETGCQQYSHEATPIKTLTVMGNVSSGTVLTSSLTQGELYAFETAGGPWTDTGSSSYGVQISDDNGSNWTDLEDYENLLCAQSTDGDHVTIYVYGAAGHTWRFRADNAIGDWTSNSGSIQVKVYDGMSSIDYWPTCKDDYTLKPVSLGTEQRKVPGNMEAGKVIPGIIEGEVYSIEITDENKWYEAGTGTGSYLVDISDDGGATWEPFEKYGTLCSEMLSNGGRFVLFFTATSSNYKLRVRDTDNDFLTNSGMVLFQLSSATDTSSPGTGDTGTPPPEWVVACNESYERPDSYIKWEGAIPVPRVGEWIDYLRSAITYYFAWCPQHTAALESIGQIYIEKEPIASIKAFLNFIQSINSILKGYLETGGAGEELANQEPELFSDAAYMTTEGGGANITNPSNTGPWDLFMVGNQDPETNVWYGGKLDMASALGSTNLSSMDSYKAICSGKFYPLLGIGANPFCSLMAMMRFTNIIKWVLLGLDFFMTIWYFFKYFPGWLHRFWDLLMDLLSIVTRVFIRAK